MQFHAHAIKAYEKKDKALLLKYAADIDVIYSNYEVYHEILADECSALLSDFFSGLREKKKQ